jgi:hypothetical protein
VYFFSTAAYPRGSSARRSNVNRFLPPLLVALAIFALAPAMGGLAPWLRARLGEGFAPVVTWVLALAGAGVVAFVLTRLRAGSHLSRTPRVALVLAGPALALLQQLVSDRGTPAEAAVERAHLLFYGGLVILGHRAFFLGRARSGRDSELDVPLLALGASSLVALGDETLQWCFALRVGELWDVGFNLFASVCGALTASGLYPLRLRFAPERATRQLLGGLWAAAFLFGALFVEIAHLGHLVSDPVLGSVRSFFSQAELARRDAERGARWASSPPRRPFGTFELEDRYQTEAGWHVQVRNEALARGERELAWRENSLLERFYPAFLSIRRDGRFEHRLEDWLRADLERELGDRPFPGYQSGAHNRRIWLRPHRAVLWTAAIAGALALALWGWRRSPRATGGPIDSMT